MVMAVTTTECCERVGVVGALRRPDIAALVRLVERCARHGALEVELELDRVPHADFRSLDQLFRAADTLAHRGCRVWVSGASPYLTDLLRLAYPGCGEGLLHELEIDVDENLDPRLGVVNG